MTGAGSGIGKATAEMLRGQGHTVVGVDLKGADITADLSTKQGRLDGANGAIEAAGGKVDAVIACAGLAIMDVLTIKVNYFGMREFINAMNPTLAKAEAPRAVLIASQATMLPVDKELVEDMCVLDDEDKAVARAQALLDSGWEGQALIYSSPKRAIARWVRREATKPQWAGAGIPLNAIVPGVVKTPMVAAMISTPEGRAMIDQGTPMPLNGYLEAEQVAKLLVFLASEDNTHITGQCVYIDGGSDALIRGENIWDLC